MKIIQSNSIIPVSVKFQVKEELEKEIEKLKKANENLVKDAFVETESVKLSVEIDENEDETSSEN